MPFKGICDECYFTILLISRAGVFKFYMTITTTVDVFKGHNFNELSLRKCIYIQLFTLLLLLLS